MNMLYHLQILNNFYVHKIDKYSNNKYTMYIYFLEHSIPEWQLEHFSKPSRKRPISTTRLPFLSFCFERSASYKTSAMFRLAL